MEKHSISTPEKIIQFNESAIQGHLSEMVRHSVEATLNQMLDAEADRLCHRQIDWRVPMLNKEDWMQIQAQIEKGVYQKDIAHQLGVHPKTVSRAVKRRGAPSGRRPAARRSKLDAFKPLVDQLLQEQVWNAVVIQREIVEGDGKSKRRSAENCDTEFMSERLSFFCQHRACISPRLGQMGSGGSFCFIRA